MIDLTGERDVIDLTDEADRRDCVLSEEEVGKRERMCEEVLRMLCALGVSEQFEGSLEYFLKDKRVTAYRIAVIGSFLADISVVARMLYPEAEEASSASMELDEGSECSEDD